MNTTLKVVIAVGAISLAAMTVWGACGLTSHIITAVDKWGNAAPGPEFAQTIKDAHQGILDVTAESRDVTIAVLKPCKKDHPETCGLIPAVRQTVQDTGAAVNVMQQQVAQTQPLINAAAKTLGDAGDAVKDSAVHIDKTADALTGTAQGATATLAEGQRTIASAQPLMAQLTANGASLQSTTDTLNDTLKRKAIGKLLDNAAGISGDFRTIADKATADFIRPVPWYMQPFHRAGDILDIGAAIARHTP